MTRIVFYATTLLTVAAFQRGVAADAGKKGIEELGLPTKFVRQLHEDKSVCLFHAMANPTVTQLVLQLSNKPEFTDVDFIGVVAPSRESGESPFVSKSKDKGKDNHYLVSTSHELSETNWGEQSQLVLIHSPFLPDSRLRLIHLRDVIRVHSLLSLAVIQGETKEATPKQQAALKRLSRWLVFPDLDDDTREYLIYTEVEKARAEGTSKHMLAMALTLLSSRKNTIAATDGTPIELRDAIQEDYLLARRYLMVLRSLPEFHSLIVPHLVQLLRRIDDDLALHDNVWRSQKQRQAVERAAFELVSGDQIAAKRFTLQAKGSEVVFRGGRWVLLQEQLGRPNQTSHEDNVQFWVYRILRDAVQANPQTLEQLKMVAEDLTSQWRTTEVAARKAPGKLREIIKQITETDDTLARLLPDFTHIERDDIQFPTDRELYQYNEDRVISLASAATILRTHARRAQSVPSIIAIRESLNRHENEAIALKRESGALVGFDLHGIRERKALKTSFTSAIRRLYESQIRDYISSHLTDKEHAIVEPHFNESEYYPLNTGFRNFVSVNLCLLSENELYHDRAKTLFTSLGKNGVVLLDHLVWYEKPDLHHLQWPLFELLGEVATPEIDYIIDYSETMVRREQELLEYIKDPRWRFRSLAAVADFEEKAYRNLAFYTSLSIAARSCKARIVESHSK